MPGKNKIKTLALITLTIFFFCIFADQARSSVCLANTAATRSGGEAETSESPHQLASNRESQSIDAGERTAIVIPTHVEPLLLLMLGSLLLSAASAAKLAVSRKTKSKPNML